MKRGVTLVVILWCIARGLSHAETEAERAANIVRQKFPNAESAEFIKSLQELVTETTPRCFELMRRIAIDSPLDALGEIKGDSEQQTTAQFLHSQIDALLLEESMPVLDGIVAARMIYVDNRDAVRLIYWKCTTDGKYMEKTVWTRMFPDNMIDPTAPLRSWRKNMSSRVSLEECNSLLPFFRDPMPPTALPSVAFQLRSNEAGIIEMVRRIDNRPSYHWAIRSSRYTRDLDFEQFQKAWQEIVGTSETKRSEQTVPSGGRKQSRRNSSADPTAPADAH